jgi:hypothetical protein
MALKCFKSQEIHTTQFKKINKIWPQIEILKLFTKMLKNGENHEGGQEYLSQFFMVKTSLC